MFHWPNGTGKSTLLELLSIICQPYLRIDYREDKDALICWQIQQNGDRYFVLYTSTPPGLTVPTLTLPYDVAGSEEWNALWREEIPFNRTHPLFRHFLKIGDFQNLFDTKLAFQPNTNDLAIHSLSEGVYFKGKFPNTTLSDALALFKNFPAFHRSNTGDLRDFWNVLIYQIKRRERTIRPFSLVKPCKRFRWPKRAVNLTVHTLKF